MTRTKHSSRKIKPRTKRTRQHIIADWSAHFVERFILDNGFTGERIYYDYGYDVTVCTFDKNGYAEGGEIKLQLKATDDIERFFRQKLNAFSFSIERKHYELWMEGGYPAFFVLYDAVKKRAYWQYIQSFFQKHPPKKADSQSLTIHIPKKNRLNSRTIKLMQKWKTEVMEQMKVVDHG